MADARLSELIETLKRQGVESGEEEKRRIEEEARKNAAEIIRTAKAEAEALRKSARDDADRERRQLASSLEIAASQFVTGLKRVVEEGFLTLPLREQLTSTLEDENFLKTLISRFVESYAAAGKTDISLLLPRAAQDTFWEWAVGLVAEKAGSGSAEDRVLRSRGVAFGFQVDQDGGVRLDFTDEAFLELFLTYLAPRLHHLFKPVETQAAGGS